MLAPWMASWGQNVFADAVPSLRWWSDNQFVRGAITGVGLITAAAGVRDMASTFMARAREASDKQLPTP